MKTPTDGDTLSRNFYAACVLCRRRSTPYPLVTCLLANNLWEIASVRVYPTVPEEGKKQMPAVVADLR